jgi:hypothetical protein
MVSTVAVWVCVAESAMVCAWLAEVSTVTVWLWGDPEPALPTMLELEEPALETWVNV